MTTVRERRAIASPDAINIAGLSPLAGVSQILGVRIFDVGQGDSFAVLGEVATNKKAVLQLDYGGRERNPFAFESDIESRMPVASGQLLMLTHWDEDHWCSASKGTSAKKATWLVPRQLTSPRAARFSATLENIQCVPERHVGQTLQFTAENGDCILWEKIGSFVGPFSKDEDCNKTGVALAIVHKRTSEEEAILLPGDAPFDKVGLFNQLRDRGVLLRGIVAFHHGAGTHWTGATERLLKDWQTTKQLDVIFSCSQPNSYGHPDQSRYEDLLKNVNFRRTTDIRSNQSTSLDLLF